MALTARLDAIGVEARKLRFGRAMLTVALAPLYVVGWSAGSAWRVAAWVIAAVLVGWKDATTSAPVADR